MNNQPAFPMVAKDKTGMIINMGMSLRDYFAAQAMQGAIAHGLFNADKGNKDYAEYVSMLAYQYADAMLKAR
jgi:hypothetical protein